MSPRHLRIVTSVVTFLGISLVFSESVPSVFVAVFEHFSIESDRNWDWLALGCGWLTGVSLWYYMTLHIWTTFPGELAEVVRSLLWYAITFACVLVGTIPISATLIELIWIDELLRWPIILMPIVVFHVIPLAVSLTMMKLLDQRILSPHQVMCVVNQQPA